MPGTLVSSFGFTLMKPELSVSTPAAPRLRRSEFGTRPSARSRWLPEILLAPSPVSSTAPSEHLAELQADIAATEHDEVLGQLGELHDARGIEEANPVEPRDGRHRGPAAGVDDDALAFQFARAAAFEFHDDAPRVLESGLAKDELEVCGFLQGLLAVIAEALDHAALAIDHPAHVYRDAAGVDAVVFRAPGEIRDAAARDHRLGGRAADVDAGAADLFALDHCELPAGASELNRQGFAGLPGADDDCIEHSSAHDASFGLKSTCARRSSRSIDAASGQYNRRMPRNAALVFAAVLAAAPVCAQDATRLLEQAKKRWAESPHGQML